MLSECGQREIWLVWAYFGPVFWALGLPLWPRMCGMVHLDSNKESGHNIDIPWEI